VKVKFHNKTKNEKNRLKEKGCPEFSGQPFLCGSLFSSPHKRQNAMAPN
jgi:hypothetical protein